MPTGGAAQSSSTLTSRPDWRSSPTSHIERQASPPPERDHSASTTPSLHSIGPLTRILRVLTVAAPPDAVLVRNVQPPCGPSARQSCLSKSSGDEGIPCCAK